MIQIKNLVKRFGNYTALNGITLSIGKGEAFGLLGPNGAGKTTLVRILSTLIKPSSGSVKVFGRDIFDDREEIKRLIGVVSHNSFLYDELTARENLTFYAGAYGVECDADKILKKVNLGARGDDVVATFSRGMKQRLSIARAIIHDPEILILDEASAGLDIKSRREFYNMLKELHSEVKTLLLTTHNLEEAELLCEKVAIMENGQIKAAGKLDDIKGEKTLEEVFIKLTGERSGY